MVKVQVSGKGWFEKFKCASYEYQQGYIIFYTVDDKSGHKEQLVLSSGHFTTIEIEEDKNE